MKQKIRASITFHEFGQFLKHALDFLFVVLEILGSINYQHLTTIIFIKPFLMFVMDKL